MAVPATAAFAITVATPCPRSDYVDVITSSTTTATPAVTIRFNVSDGTHLSPARNVTWPLFSPTETATSITIS
nr:hypothetical protein [uncultured Actinoplanes sp.]